MATIIRFDPLSGTPEWRRQLDEQDTIEMSYLAADEIGERLGFARGADGDWSDSEAAAILAECRRRLGSMSE